MRERFSPSTSDAWLAYVESSGFKHVEELVTLDGMLCGNYLSEVLDEDWSHNVHEDFRLDLFLNPQYPLTRHPIKLGVFQLLAVLEKPTMESAIPDGFSFCGFDIMDSYVGNSTLTNCGRIPWAFSPNDVNRFGLIEHLEEATAIRDTMRKREPDDSHLGLCEVWLMARRIPEHG